ncbi:MAG: DUF4956 domain-containing protein [Chloroflexi bacterium]|nr:MAG: DUF4956 domain-containing protein [Chloroflexota bacterium]
MEFHSLFSSFQSVTETFTLFDVLASVGLSFLLSAVIAWVYRATYRGLSYSQNYVHTLIMMSMIVAVIMLVIGSNIARAFSLVGALSIIRFRNAIKDTRDVGFIFFAMAIGMACGTGFFQLAIVSTVAISAILFGMSHMNLFARDAREQILKLRLPEGSEYETALLRLFEQYLDGYRLISMKVGRSGGSTKFTYLIQLRPDVDRHVFLKGLQEIHAGNITLMSEETTVEG